MLRPLVIVIAALALIPCAAAATTPPKAKALLHQVNIVRAQHGLRPLSLNKRLQRAAVAHSGQMLSTGVFAHGAFGTRLQQFDVTARIAGENLYWGVGSLGSARAVVAAWLASPEHRANLLSPAYRRIGIGDLAGRFDGYARASVVTADFAG